MISALLIAGAIFTSRENTYNVSAINSNTGYGVHAAFSEADLEWIKEARESLRAIVRERTIMALVYLSDEYAVRLQPDFSSEVVVTVPSGQLVRIRDVSVNSPEEVWEYVSLSYGGKEYSGYVERKNLACSDEIFLEWEAYYGLNPQVLMSMGIATMSLEEPSSSEASSSEEEPSGSEEPSSEEESSSSEEPSGSGEGSSGDDSAMEEKELSPDVAVFPESYQASLQALKEAHPNWTFVKMNTGLKWDVVVENEMVRGRNLIPSSFPEYMQDGLHSTNWAFITEDALKYYLDPRNGLTETDIFQFEQLTYNESYHTEAAVQAFLDNTFMSGIIPNTVLTYAKTFYAVGVELAVSPFHLACRVYQEQGDGTSPLISGTYKDYEGYYNYFNIDASGTTQEQVIISGLERAKKENWYNGYYSIYGGAKIISSNYILQGQDTLYLQKFDVDASNNGLYWHQYMQNVCAPTSEGRNIRKSYEQAGSLENTFVFKLPVYETMPEEACAKPTVSYTVSVPVLEGYEDAVIYLDGVAHTAKIYDGRYMADAPDGNVKTAAMYRNNENNVPVGMYVWELSHDGKVYTETAVPELENLLSYHGFSIRIVGKSGIRFKTGISEEVKSKLLSTEGLGGYTLKEYGTLVMNHANMEQYPLVKGGEKVLSGLSYGVNEAGETEDKVYETVDGRNRFTSVLVGLPVSQYQTEFAFRGYIILYKQGQDIILYGPAVWRSIYTLSEQVLALGQYEEGSDADVFLKKLISDADAWEMEQTQTDTP